ncbi:MAG: DUF550 domain-containing protein [Bacteroidetes bacterium]|nr:DUF550 domain-containing protein [Bacteroidota bacterium]
MYTFDNWDSLSDIQHIIGLWQRETFPEATPLSAAKHLLAEVGELIVDLESGRDASFELADCLHLVIAVAERADVHLADVTRTKFMLNQGRTWGEPNDEGFTEHIRPA